VTFLRLLRTDAVSTCCLVRLVAVRPSSLIEDISACGDVATVAGMIDVTMEGQTLVFGGASVLESEITASNGIIHPIDGVATRWCLQIDLDEPLEC
jgi:hypothetical protein